LAYHSGGLYEVLLAAIVSAIAWPLGTRLRQPLALTWLVVALFALGRFFEFFLRSDSADLALGLEIAQWTSLVLLAVAGAGAWLTLEGRPAPRPRPPPARGTAVSGPERPRRARRAATFAAPGRSVTRRDEPNDRRPAPAQYRGAAASRPPSASTSTRTSERSSGAEGGRGRHRNRAAPGESW
jgi:Prolipoprotein diacylglyceryl transferase